MSGPALECPEDALPGEQQDGQQAPGWSPRCGQHPAETPRRRQWRRGWAGPPSQRRAVGFRHVWSNPACVSCRAGASCGAAADPQRNPERVG